MFSLGLLNSKIRNSLKSRDVTLQINGSTDQLVGTVVECHQGWVPDSLQHREQQVLVTNLLHYGLVAQFYLRRDPVYQYQQQSDIVLKGVGLR